METCYEYLGCEKKDCIMYQIKDTVYCWEVEGTLCNHCGISIVRDRISGKKEDSCNHCGCIYYRAMKEEL